MDKKRVAFITTNLNWGGSEELWAAAARYLAEQGFSVSASIGYACEHGKIQQLMNAGVKIHTRPTQYPFLTRAIAKFTSEKNALIDADIAKFLKAAAADLTVVSDGIGMLRAPGILNLLCKTQARYAIVSHLHGELFWPDDNLAALFRRTLSSAQQCYFVSEGNRQLFEKQIGCRLSNTKIVRNPFNVKFDAKPPWPPSNNDSALRLANVARLEPLMKGQDILLDALAAPIWKDRNWCLTFYGEGAMKNGLERLVAMYRLENRVRFAGFVNSVEDIWAENHCLVLGSRYEGMPLAIVEAMLCARPVVATDVGGNREIIVDNVTGFLAETPTPSALNDALDRLWQRRSEIRLIGEAGAKSIREKVPSDPARSFAETIMALV